MKKIHWLLIFIFAIAAIVIAVFFVKTPALSGPENSASLPVLSTSLKEAISEIYDNAEEEIVSNIQEQESDVGNQNIANQNIQSEKIKTIVLVTLDTLRAGHYGFMGYPRNTTPFLDKLANDGVLFKNAFTVVSETGPSISSMFTSLYPFEHHIVNNSIKLDSFYTLPEYLRELGYNTGGFVSAMYFNTINNKFDYFNFEGDPALGPELGMTRRGGDKTINKAKEWISKKSPSEKIFLWVHLFDAHLPFDNGINYIENQGDRLSGDTLINFWVNNQGVNLDFFTGEQKESLAKVMNQYDGELQFIDKQLEDLFNFMSQNGYNKNSLWIITSDHGEGLGSHSYFGHFERAYNEQLKAPIIFYNPEHKNEKVINSLVENIDIMPTLANLIGFKIQGYISGKSLIPLISGLKDNIRNYIFGMRGEVSRTGSSEFATRHLPVKKLQENEEFLGQLYSLQDSNYKLIYSPENQGRDKLFNLKKDPNELNNLINNPDMKLMAEDMKNKIQEILSGKAVLDNNGAILQNKMLEESLRALGY